MARYYWNFRTLLACALTLLALVFFGLFVPGFFTLANLYAILQTFAPLALVAAGLAVVMIAAEFDLSIAGVLTLSGIVVIKVTTVAGLAVGILAALLVSVLIGLLNGWLTARFRLPSLAVTVGSLVLTTGLGYWATGAETATLADYHFGLWLDEPMIGGVLSMGTLMMALLVAGIVFVMGKTRSGIVIRAIGSDSDRARASGLPVSGTVIAAFVLSGLFAGVAGTLQGLTLAAQSPGDNLDFLLRVVTAAIIGGVSIHGARGQILGVAAGALFLAVVSNGLSLAGTSTAVIQLVNGGILLLIVVFDVPLNRMATRFLPASRSVSQPVVQSEMSRI